MCRGAAVNGALKLERQPVCHACDGDNWMSKIRRSSVKFPVVHYREQIGGSRKNMLDQLVEEGGNRWSFLMDLMRFFRPFATISSNREGARNS